MTLFLLYSGHPNKMPEDNEIRIIVYCQGKESAGGDGSHDSDVIEYIKSNTCQ
jgi:hypothetical protein